MELYCNVHYVTIIPLFLPKPPYSSQGFCSHIPHKLFLPKSLLTNTPSGHFSLVGWPAIPICLGLWDFLNKGLSVLKPGRFWANFRRRVSWDSWWPYFSVLIFLNISGATDRGNCSFLLEHSSLLSSGTPLSLLSPLPPASLAAVHLPDL